MVLNTPENKDQNSKSKLGECSTINSCRVCDGSNLSVFFDLGNQPLANALLRSQDEPDEVFPLRLGFCPQCTLVQLMETVPKEKLFRNYVWVSGTAATTRNYADLFCERALKALGNPTSAFIVEIASNDGLFLGPFQKKGFTVLGVDPAQNIAAEATANGIETWPEFWNVEIARKVRREKGAADFAFARNVVPHVSDLQSVISGLSEVLSDDGLGMIEFHQAGQIYEELHYDSIYHEHLSYFSLGSMEYLLKRHGLHPFHIEISPISGGSIVVHFQKKARSLSKEYSAQIRRELELGLNRVETWDTFAKNCQEHRQQISESLGQFKFKKIVGFGASARSSTFLNYASISTNEIEAVIDNNPRKQGRYTPGSRIPILTFNEGMSLQPDVIFLLAWNFADEIMLDCKKRGFTGHFIRPFPGKPQVIQ